MRAYRKSEKIIQRKKERRKRKGKVADARLKENQMRKKDEESKILRKN